jgi:hypothetical protein
MEPLTLYHTDVEFGSVSYIFSTPSGPSTVQQHPIVLGFTWVHSSGELGLGRGFTVVVFFSLPRNKKSAWLYTDPFFAKKQVFQEVVEILVWPLSAFKLVRIFSLVNFLGTISMVSQSEGRIDYNKLPVVLKKESMSHQDDTWYWF